MSDPYHERYGAHLSKEEVEALVAPHDESIDVVNAWLASHGIKGSDITRSPAMDWAYIKVPVSKAEEMLDTVSLSTQLIIFSLLNPIERNTTSGNMSRAVMLPSARPSTASPSTCTNTSTSFSPPLFSLASRE